MKNNKYRIRKLTPKECWRLMGFSDKQFEKAKEAGISNTQLYKQAGNSIVTDVLYYIFKELYEAMPYLFDDLKVSSYFSGIGAFESALDRLYTDINSGNIATPTCVNSEPAGGEIVVGYQGVGKSILRDLEERTEYARTNSPRHKTKPE